MVTSTKSKAPPARPGVGRERMLQEFPGQLVVAVLCNEVGREVRPTEVLRVEGPGLSVGRDRLVSETVDVVGHSQATAEEARRRDGANRLQLRLEMLADVCVTRLDGGHDRLGRKVRFRAPGE